MLKGCRQIDEEVNHTFGSFYDPCLGCFGGSVKSKG